MKTLIIGGAGYIGSALMDWLPGSDSIDLGWYSPVANPRDFASLTAAELREYDAVILLAGHSSVKACFDPVYSQANNVSNFRNLILKLSPRQKFIYASSVSVYGQFSGMATEENETWEPHGNYDLQKTWIDKLAKESGLDYYGLRFGTVNGYSPVLRTDLMVNAMVKSAKEDGVVNVHFGSTRRPILWIVDLCDAVPRILSSGIREPGIYNVLTLNSTAAEIGQTVARVFDCPCVESSTLADGTKLRSSNYDFHASRAKFERVFNWAPRAGIATIAHDLIDNWGKVKHFGRRDESRKYPL